MRTIRFQPEALLQVAHVHVDPLRSQLGSGDERGRGRRSPAEHVHVAGALQPGSAERPDDARHIRVEAADGVAVEQHGVRDPRLFRDPVDGRQQRDDGLLERHREREPAPLRSQAVEERGQAVLGDVHRLVRPREAESVVRRTVQRGRLGMPDRRSEDGQAARRLGHGRCGAGSGRSPREVHEVLRGRLCLDHLDLDDLDLDDLEVRLCLG